MLQLAQASEEARPWCLAIGSVHDRFQPAPEQASRGSRRSFFGFVPEHPPQRSLRNLPGGVEAGKGRAPLASGLWPFWWGRLQPAAGFSRLPGCPTNFSDFAARHLRYTKSKKRLDGDCWSVSRRAEARSRLKPAPPRLAYCTKEWRKSRGELRSPDKLKHVPRKRQTP